MADLSDVENALVQLSARWLGLGLSYIPGSTVSSPLARGLCRVYRGWPKSNTLNDDLEHGVSTITVFPVAGSTRRSTRYLPQWRQAGTATPSMTVTVNGNQVTIGGTTSIPGQIVTIAFGSKAWAYRPVDSDTQETVCMALATLIASSSGSTTPIGDGVGNSITDDTGAIISAEGVVVNGSTMTIGTTRPIRASVSCDQTAIMETRRQDQNIWIIGWCPTPQIRDKVMALVDDGFANMLDDYGNLTYEIPLPDGSNAEIRYISNHTDDNAQQDNLWRRDLRYVLCYPTTLTQIQTPLITPGGMIDAHVDLTASFGAIDAAP